MSTLGNSIEKVLVKNCVGHEVKIRTEGRQGIRSAADECGKEAVVSQPVDPKGKGQLGQTF